MHDSRRYGTQALPVRIYFPEETDYTVFLGRGHEVRRFREAIEKTRRHVPELVPWLEHHAPRAVSHLEAWNGLLLACRYFLDHPRPNLYLRQLPLAVDTKFIEEHAGILRQMLDAVLPEESVDRQAPDFERRFGLRYDEPLVRIRLLDERLPECAGWPSDDVTLPVSCLSGLGLSACTVVISENKMTFLTLPAVERGAALWGGGFRVDVLRDVPWLRACRVFYWGDLDAQGFMILSRLRSFLPEARSLMMDVDTFETFREFAVPGTPTEAVPLPNLSPEESAVFESLARTNLRLEQERIPQAYVAGRLAQDVGAS